MVSSDHVSPIQKDETAQGIVSCPYCEYRILMGKRGENFLICGECRRKVYDVCISAARMRLLLDAFGELSILSYDKELNMYVHSVGQAVDAELRARGFHGFFADEADPARPPEPEMVISQPDAKGLGLSSTAFQALNELLRDHDFGSGCTFLDNVLLALRAIGKATAAQGRLRRQLEAMPFETRASVSSSIRVMLRK